MTNGTDDKDRIREFVVRAVHEHWNQTRKALLLSALGSKIRREFGNAPSMMPDGLGAFLDSRPTVQIVGHPDIREKVCAVPLDAKIPDNPAELFDERHRMSDEANHPIVETYHPRYVPEFWRAFHTRLTGRRFVIPPDSENPNVRIVEPIDGAEETRGYEILPSDLAILPTLTPLSEKVFETSQRIKAWLARNNLSAQLFVSHSPAPFRGTAALRSSGQRDSVALALARLDPSDQARIFIPLDIVAKIIAGIL
jgi:hypothetical protein